MLNLTNEARRVYKLIQERINSGKNAPSIKEIEIVLSLSTRKVVGALRELEDSLIIKRSPYKSRTIEIITPIDEHSGKLNDETVEVPILGTAPGGPMLLAGQNYEDTLAVPIRLLRGRRDVFLLRVTGNSMSPYLDPDIEQVQNDKKPFTLRWILCRTTQLDSGEVPRWNRSASNAWIILVWLPL